MEKVIDQGLINTVEERLMIKKMKLLRRFGFSFSIGMAVLTTILFIRGAELPYKLVPIGLGLYSMTCVVLNAKYLQWLHAVLTTILTWIGHIITFTVFTVVFYGLFTPIALILRLFGKDLIRTNSKNPHWVDVPQEHNEPDLVKKLY